MDNTGREAFWNVLKDLHDSSGYKLTSVLLQPKYLCRFRPVSQSSLTQLNDNTLFFSSANYYDDPFDTYFYLDTKQMAVRYNEMRQLLTERNPEFMNSMKQIAAFIGQNSDDFINILSESEPDFSNIQEQLLDIRSSIQKRLFSICFCEDPYNETLWLKYASNYSGFVQLYDMDDQNTMMCGKGKECQGCPTVNPIPAIYPVYYSDKRYDATRYAVGMMMLNQIHIQNNRAVDPLCDLLRESLLWEAERISLIKKKCHENDQEWRMIRPIMTEERSYIKMKPCKVIIGLRTPDYESRLIVSAALNAGVKEIHRLFINDDDRLDSKSVSTELYHL